MTLIGPDSWAAIRGAAAAALTAAGLVSSGERLAYALCRPPGHHVTRSAYGGSCYLNNAAIAAQALIAAGAGRVAVLDIDAHHGNGTQSIFYARGDVWYGSVPFAPGAGWFPHYVGYADERGAGPGEGANRNLPLPPGTGDDGWLAAVRDPLAAPAAHHPAPRPRRRRNRPREPPAGNRGRLPRNRPPDRRPSPHRPYPGRRLRSPHPRPASRSRPHRRHPSLTVHYSSR